MKALVLEEPKKYAIQDLPMPEIGDDQCLLKVRVTAICVNDVRDYQGSKWSYPRCGGHEYSAVIEKMGKNVDKETFHIGQQVVAYIIENCGYCPSCHDHHENICENHLKSKIYYNEDGISGFFGFSEYIAMDARYLYPCSDQVSDEELAMTEPLACVLNSINRSHIEIGDDVVVIGGGVMGMLHVLAAKKKGARVILSETDAKRRQFGLELGADEVIDPLASDPIQQIKELTGGKGANVVCNSTALPSVAAQAVEMAAKSGTVNMFSSIHPNEPIAVDAGRIHSQEITLTGTQNGSKKTFAQAIDCITKRIIDVKPLIEKVFDYQEVTDAMDFASRPDTYKVMMRFSK